MVATGLIRRVDDLGRIVIPKELREKVFGSRYADGEPMEFFYEKEDDKIVLILKPYEIGK
jgi:AbrB family looped-hinge helix DNA binding protein